MADKPKLTRAERKQIEAVIRKYRGDGKPHTAQDTIPYQIMYPDGICYLGNRRYSQSIEFFDINYLLAQPDDQTAIFEYLCDLYNYLDSSIHVQFTYPNRKSDREQLARSFEMPPAGDGLDPIRQEQTDILKRQLARGNNGSVKTKYITYTIEADNLKAARARLSRISLDIQGYFKIMGAVSRVLDGKRFRKWGGVPTGATQNVKDLLSSPEIENILENSDFICMLNQAAGDRKILAERLNISPEQLKFVTNSPPGEGLLFFENVILPFADKFPRDTELYRIMSTKPSEVNGV